MSAANMIEDMLAVSLRGNGCECAAWLHMAQLHMASVRVMWSLLSDSPTGAVVEVNGDADKVSEGLSGIGEYRVVEVFCHAPPGPSGRGYQPLGLGPRRHVDLSRPVDTDELVTWILCRASGN